MGQRGVNLVEKIVLEMGFVWNPIHFEAGIDGQIEIADQDTGEATNKIVQVQVKAVENEFQADNGKQFSFSCERAHIDYWLNGTAPVILVVCKPRTGEAYWVNIAHYFSDPASQGGCTIRFAKDRDRFDVCVAPRLLESAAPEGGLYLGPLPKSETLISNLFPVFRMPTQIFAAETDFRNRDEFVEELRPLKRPDIREWILKDGKIYSLHDLRREPLSDLCDQGTVEIFNANEWAESDNPAIRRDFVRFLNICLGQLCHERGLAYNRETGMSYFIAPVDGSDRSIQCQAFEKNGTRKVVERRLRKDAPEQTYCFRHHAFIGSFLSFDGKWFLEVTPTYYFSKDGSEPFAYAEDLQSGIKRLERHRAVVGHLLMWMAVLAGRELGYQYRFLELDAPAEFTLDVGIDDEAWQRNSSEEAADHFQVPEEASEELQEMLW
jgi:hypothetical protein